MLAWAAAYEAVGLVSQWPQQQSRADLMPGTDWARAKLTSAGCCSGAVLLDEMSVTAGHAREGLQSVRGGRRRRPLPSPFNLASSSFYVQLSDGWAPVLPARLCSRLVLWDGAPMPNTARELGIVVRLTATTRPAREATRKVVSCILTVCFEASDEP
jgi:hypothetical protein